MTNRLLWRLAVTAVAVALVVSLADIGLLDAARLARGARNLGIFVQELFPPEPSVLPTLLEAMIETLFRVRGGTVEFKTLSLQPRPFLGAANGFEMDYEHLDSDELWRQGRMVGAVINGRLYLILLDAAKSQYYPETLPDFEAIVTSAQLRG